MGNTRSTRNSATKLQLPTKSVQSPVGYSMLDRKTVAPFIAWAVSVEGEYEVSDASKLLGYRRMYHLAMYILKNHKDHPHAQVVVDRIWEILTALLGRNLTAEKRKTYTRHIQNIESAEAGKFDWDSVSAGKGKKSSKVSRRHSKSEDAPKTPRKKVAPKTEAKTEAPPQGNHDGDVQKSNTVDRILALLEAGKISEAFAERMMDKAEAESE